MSTPPLSAHHLSRLRSDFTGHLAALLQGARGAAVVDFPNHTNCGDSLIWRGEEHTLRRLGVRITYLASRQVRSDPRVGGDPTSPVLCHGGGNFGDIDRRSVRLRERIVAACADRPVIFLPQSIHYADTELRDKDAAALRAHPRLTVMVRDEPSLAQAEAMGLHAVLTPDAAFGADPFRPRASDRARAGRPPVAAIWRTDKEVAASALGQRGAGRASVRAADWLPGHGAPHLAVGAVLRGAHVVRAAPTAWLAQVSASRVAAYEVGRARRLIAGADVLTTDRLHAAVLGLMLGKRVVWVDNSYGKLSAVLGRWVDPAAGWERAPDRPSAEQRATELADSLS